MYPFVHLLPDGNLFILSDRSSQVVDLEPNDNIRVVRDLPELQGLHRVYPNTGGSVLLSLTAANAYHAQIMICGGGEENMPSSRTDDTCAIIGPSDQRPKWTTTKMLGGPRTMVEAILLLDGRVLWLNGARRGVQGFGTASVPATEALIYDPTSNSWSSAGTSSIPRMYHSVALMLLDGTILVARSNPNEMPILDMNINRSDPLRAFPTEFRVERYIPPYLLGEKGSFRPKNIHIESVSHINSRQAFRIRFEKAKSFKECKFYLYSNGFVTHSLHMGQTMIELQIHKWEEESKVTVTVPPIKIAPGPYVVFVVVDGVPGIGEFVSIRRP